MNVDQLLTHYDKVADAPDSIARLRRFILDLAVRGKLVEQDPNDEPASESLKRISQERMRRAHNESPRRRAVPGVDIDTLPFGVPTVWTWATVHELMYVEMGQSPPSEFYNQTGDGLPFYQGKADFGHLHPSPKYWCIRPKKQAFPGDILISIRAPVGPTNLADKPCCIGRGLAALRPYPEVDTRYILLSLKAFKPSIEAIGFGSTFVAITKNQLMSFPLALPPLAEQRRIVAKVNELMSLCDQLETVQADREATRDRLAAVSLTRLNTPDPAPVTFQKHAAFAIENLASLTTRLDQVKALRQTILNLAVRGKLVEQNSNDEPALELLKRIAAEKARLVKTGEIRKTKVLPPIDKPPFALPLMWSWARMRQVSSDRGQRIPDADFNYIDVTSIDMNRGVVASPRVISAIEAPSRARKIVQKGDVIYSCVRPYLLNVAIVQQTFDPPPIASTAFAILNGHGFVLPRYKWFVLRSPFMVAHVEEKMRGQSYPAINDKDFSLLPFPLPPLAEQHRIVAKVDELMALCDQLEASLSTGDDTRLRLLDALLHDALMMQGMGQ